MKKSGILTAIIFSLALFLSACGGKSDADIQREVQGRIKTQGVTVSSVKEGVVTLGGTVTSQAERDAAVAAARGEGVKDVKENIQIKPMPTPMVQQMPAAPMGNTMSNPPGKTGAMNNASAPAGRRP